MAVHVLCITSNGGLPLFARKKGDGNALPFSVVASLNGVHMFGKSHDAILKSTSTQETTFVWEEFENSVVLVGGASCASEWVLRRLLRAVFDAMVLLVGLDEIRSLRNPDRLKRELRVCYPLIDRLMDAVDNNINNSSGNCLNNNSTSNTNATNSKGSNSVSSGDLLGLSEAILCYEGHALMTCLDVYAECMNSQFASIIVCGREAVSTPAWNELQPSERQLLSLLAGEGTPCGCTSSDTPVFLPYKSPTVPFRLVWVLLVPGVSVLTLCGPTPGLSEAEHLALQCWTASADQLRAAAQIIPRNVPHSIQFDNGVLGFLLLRIDIGKYVLSCSTNGQALWPAAGSDGPNPGPSASHRLHVLRTFYHQAAVPLLLTADSLVTPQSGDEKSVGKENNALEAYWCSEYHKCHGIRSKDMMLCVLYASAVPTHTMRILTQRTLKLLTSDKQLCW